MLDRILDMGLCLPVCLSATSRYIDAAARVNLVFGIQAFLDFSYTVF